MIETVVFIIGAFLGGLIARYSFKSQSSIKFEILEIIIFYLILFLFESRIQFSNSIFLFGIVGFLSSIAARGISSKFVYADIKIKRKTGRYGLLFGLENALRRRGFEKDEIKKIAEEVGFKREEIRMIK